MSILDNDAKTILDSAPAPDASAVTLKEAGNAPEKRGRGRPAGSKASGKKSAQNTTKNKADFAACEASAKAVNTIVFSLACAGLGTGAAWPSEEKSAVMDKALARYMEIKGMTAPPEAALIAAYAAYIQEAAIKKEVQEAAQKRFGKFAGKFTIFQKVAEKFKRKAKLEKDGK